MILLKTLAQASWLEFAGICLGALLLIQIIRRATRKKDPNAQAILDAYSADPANWKAGIFYYNPKDHRIFPPKRMSGLGWTINFANPMSIFTMIALIIIAIAIGSQFRH